MKKMIVISWVVCVLALVGLMSWLGNGVVPRGDGSTGQALIKGEFTLQNAQGKPVTANDFRGRYMLIYFGYTRCPDICPTTLLLMQNAVAHLGKQAKKVQPIFITIDPERDTPAAVGEYVTHFGDGIVGLSGTPAQIKQVTDNFKIYVSKVEDKGSALGYMMDHSGFIYLMGPDGNYITHFPHNVAEQALQDGLADHVQ